MFCVNSGRRYSVLATRVSDEATSPFVASESKPSECKGSKKVKRISASPHFQFPL